MTSLLTEIQARFEQLASPEKAAGMAAYMRNLFPFLGISTEERRTALYELLKAHGGKKQSINTEAVRQLYALPGREYQYAAIDYLEYLSKQLDLEHVPLLEELLTTDSWWDTVDYLRKEVSYVVARHPEAGRELMDAWLISPNFWLRRIAITHQLGWRTRTDVQWLATACTQCAHEREFFIAKAIGWALRDYGRTDPAWVREFVRQHENDLAPLSVREALKRL